MTTGLKIGIGACLGTGAVGATAGVSYLVTQPKDLKEDLEKSGIELLDTKKEGANDDDTSWKILAQKHSEDPLTDGTTKIENLTISKHTGQDPHPWIEKLKDECEKLFKKTKKDNDYEKAKKDAENWCSKASPLLPKT